MACVLITGGAGFIGSHLAEALIAPGNKVIVIDDLSTGSIKNIEHLKAKPDFEYHIGSIMDVPLMAELVDKSDEVYHLAAAVGVRLIVDSPVKTIETNIKGTEIVLELANKKKKKVLVVSTSEVYGKSSNLNFNEDDDLVLGPTVRPRWSYACSKAIDEFLALAYWKEKELPVIIARLFNTVGPRQTGRYGMVVPRFIAQALLGKPITVYGDGSQRRCFMYVKDAVRAFIGLMGHPGAFGQVFNVGSEEEISMLKLARLIKERTNSRSEIVFVPYEEAYDKNFEDMNRRRPDIAKLKHLLGFELEYKLINIIDSFVDYARKLDNLESLI